MQELTRAMWDFMEGAYRQGLLDELLGMAGGLMDPEMDLGDAMGDFEDALSEADFAPFEEMSREVLAPVMSALADEEVIEGLHVFVTTMRPVIEGVVQGAGGDIRLIAEMGRTTA